MQLQQTIWITFFFTAKKLLTIITAIVGIRIRSWWRVYKPETNTSWKKSIKLISKQRMSSSSSFLNIISPDTEDISWFFGSIFLIFTLLFDTAPAIVNSSHCCQWINFFKVYKSKFLHSLQVWCLWGQNLIQQGHPLY